ncbi:MAG: M20/M25/M40 family metallo-hydrolase [Phycisphaerales bacterium]|nr:M20/M25/M40 family metallo-hydrolase [Phycisphaerales bacterium]
MTHRTHHAITAVLPLTILALTGCSASIHVHEHPPADRATHESHVEIIEPTRPWSEISTEKKSVGRITFTPQPTEEELRAFAMAGGSVVINNRTAPEMQRVPFDEQRLVESLGMRYISLPTSSGTFTQDDARAFGRVIEQTNGPVLAHCASGSRSVLLYAMDQHLEHGLSKNEAIALGYDLGMWDRGGRVMERELMDMPDRVMDAVDPAHLRTYIDTLAGFGTRHTLSDTESDSRGIGAARRWVEAQFERNIDGNGKTGDAAPRVYFDAHTVEPDGRRITQTVEVVNVICEIPGSDPDSRDRLYYVLGHLDSRATEANDATSDAPGANDDASGVALMIELARVLAKEPIESTVILMATSGEEQGLFGARLHAQAAKEAGKDIVAVLNNDTVGDPTGVLEGQDGSKEIRVFSEGLPAPLITTDESEISSAVRRLRLYGTESDSPSRQLARYIADVADLHKTTVQPRLIHRPDRFLRGGDHTPFNELGFSAIRFCETYENYDHQHQDVRIEEGKQYGDLPEFVDEHYLADVTRLNALTLVHLTNAPSAPDNCRVIIAELTNDTTLRWDASPESDVAGYEIVWRETSSSQWEEVQDVGNATEGTVPLSKDNYFFGVRCYDKDGYRSLVSYPVPARE